MLIALTASVLNFFIEILNLFHFFWNCEGYLVDSSGKLALFLRFIRRCMMKNEFSRVLNSIASPVNRQGLLFYPPSGRSGVIEHETWGQFQ